MLGLRMALSGLVVGSLWSSTAASAQPLGTFRWQMQPYCNLLTLNIAQQNGVYALDGTDDRCSAGQAASAVGIAFLNPNGTIGFGVTMVQPAGVPVHLEAAISLPSLNGTWRDSSGASGNFVLTPGASIGGPPRQVSSSGLPPASITAVHLLNGAVTGGAIAANSITTGHVADGSLTAADLQDAPRVSSVETGGSSVTLPIGDDSTVTELAVTAPAAGHVVLNTSGAFIFASDTILERVRCSLTPTLITAVPFSAFAVENSAAGYSFVPFGGTRTFNVAAGSSTTFRLVCRAFDSQIRVFGAVLTAIFVARS